MMTHCTVVQMVPFLRENISVAMDLTKSTHCVFQIYLLLLWGYIKDIFYATPVHNACDLHHRITETINSITLVMLLNTWDKIEYRLDILRTTNGTNIKVRGQK
ncbi:hypothetical protein CEXT_198431 [Caerostris extrusa]|uniref:Uncharacterized protein n=1 Tax=Caerostris extrusa TaxID=172846 RepID=A0AAV4SRU3_CAEEX|nr:hypothetical protein CEXT_198431 [Caerostris extrusa]